MENLESSEKERIIVDAVVQEKEALNDEDYFRYPAKLQDEGTDKDFERTKADIERRFNELLAALSEETLQLSEFLIEEKKLIKELCTLLRETLRHLNLSFEVPAEAVPELQSSAKKIILNNEGHLILMFEGEKVSSKILEDHSPRIVLTVIWSIIPELNKALQNYRRRISQRVNIFERIRKELKNIRQIFTSSEQREEVSIGGGGDLKNPIFQSEKEKGSSKEV